MCCFYIIYISVDFCQDFLSILSTQGIFFGSGRISRNDQRRDKSFKNSFENRTSRGTTNPRRSVLRGVLLLKTSKMVTFGHHIEEWGPKNASKTGLKNIKKFAFCGGATKNKNYYLLHRRFFSNRLSLHTFRYFC